MVKIVLIRHGETDYNRENRVQGQLNSTLTPEGLEQAEAVTDWVAEHYAIDAIYASDLNRTVNTAKPLADRLGLPIHTTKELRELHLGLWQGLLYTDAVERFPETARKRKEDPGNTRYEEGESYCDLMNRATKEMDRIAKENDGKTIAVYSHGGTIRAMICAWMGIPIKDIFTVPPIPNTAVNVLTYENGKVEFLLRNSVEHTQNAKAAFAE